MKHFVFIALFLVLPTFSWAQDISGDQIKFVNQFKGAIMDHNVNKVYRFLDKDYRKSQRKFLQGDKAQLLNELFSGSDNETYVTIPIQEILKFEVAEIAENEDGSFTYIFRVRDVEHDILSYLQLVKKGKKFGFVGAVG
jgi:hypothetical protein